MSKELKTVTLGQTDNPTISVCEGHVTAEVFNKAFQAEGWSPSDTIDLDLRHLYYSLTPKRKHYRFHAYPGQARKGQTAKPCTVMDW